MTSDVQEKLGPGMRPGAVAAGAVLLTIGMLMLVDTTGTVRVNAGQFIAPLILIAIGASKLLDGRRGGLTSGGRRGGRGTGGFWLIGIGVWMLVSQAHLFGLSYQTSWPLLLIMAGLTAVIRGMR